MKKYVMAIFLTSVCLVGSLFANGKGESKNSKADKEMAVKYTPWGTYPIVEEPINVDIMVVQAPCVEDFNTNEFSKFMEEKTNIHVNFIQIPNQGAKEKLALTLASGDYPDAFLGFHEVITNDMISTYGVQEHLLMPLNEYFTEDKMPNLMEGSKSYGDTFIPYMTSLDGNIYSLPGLSCSVHQSNSVKMYIYKPFLDALHLPIPTTTEEFYQTLKAFKEKDPNGNGLQDEIPMAGASSGWNTRVTRFLLNAFLPCNLDLNINENTETLVGYYMDGKTIKTSVNQDKYRDALRYLHKLYAEGLLYNGTFTQDNKQLTQLVESSDLPTVGVSAGGIRAQFSSFGGERFENFRAMAPLAGPTGFRNASDVVQNPLTGAVLISKDCPYAEALIRYFDYFYSMEGTLNSRCGVEGVDWARAEPGELGLDGTQATWKEFTPYDDQDPQNKTWIKGLVSCLNFELRSGEKFKQVSYTEPEYYKAENSPKNLNDDTIRLYKPYSHPEYDVPTLKYTADEIEEFSTVKSELASYIRQSAVKFIVGSMDIDNDTVWNKYLSNLEKLGMSDVLANMQTAYDRQYK